MGRILHVFQAYPGRRDCICLASTSVSWNHPLSADFRPVRQCLDTVGRHIAVKRLFSQRLSVVQLPGRSKLRHGRHSHVVRQRWMGSLLLAIRYLFWDSYGDRIRCWFQTVVGAIGRRYSFLGVLALGCIAATPSYSRTRVPNNFGRRITYESVPCKAHTTPVTANVPGNVSPDTIVDLSKVTGFRSRALTLVRRPTGDVVGVRRRRGAHGWCAQLESEKPKCSYSGRSALNRFRVSLSLWEKQGSY